MPLWLKIVLGVGAGVGVFFMIKKIRQRVANKTATANTATAHFSRAEFDCKDGTPVPTHLHGNVQRLMSNLEVIRAATGGKRITINSGYRTPAHNRKVGGEANSMHLFGMAADIKVEDMTAKAVQALILKLVATGKIHDGGLGQYPTFTHYDIGHSRRW